MKEVDIVTEETQEQCKHTNKEYQPYERDTNVGERYFCLDCDKDLPIPEPDWDLMNKED